jgi:tungstate transport system ATP-binding protein
MYFNNGKLMKPAISIRNLRVNQGVNFSLSIESLDLYPRRIYALTGPNGAGKSTLLRTLALLVSPQSGFVSIAGTDSLTLTQQRQRITLVEQSPYLLVGSVYDNLAFGLKLRGIGGTEQTRRIMSALALVGLDDFAQRQAGKLSAGEKQRTALARGLVLDPEVLLLDEPTSNIDNKSLHAFEALLASLPGLGMTVVFSTHDLSQPERIGAVALRMEEGSLLDIPHWTPETGDLNKRRRNRG